MGLQFSSFDSAERALLFFVPNCSEAILQKLREESVTTAADLSALDKDDLRELGLRMVERARVLRWAREEFNGHGDRSASQSELQFSSFDSAERALLFFVPNCSEAILQKLREESVTTAADLS